MKVVLAISVLIISVAAEVPSRIIGGQNGQIEQFPSTLQIESRLLFVWRTQCSGSAVTSRWFISSIRCFGPGADGNRRVRAGATSRLEGGTVINVDRYILHPDYAGIPTSYDSDLALGRLDYALTFSDAIQPTTILVQGTDIPTGAQVSIVGWGAINEDGSYADVLQHANVLVLDRESCNTQIQAYPNNWLYNYRVTDNMICTGTFNTAAGIDACDGDLGAPVLLQNILVGVVSWGIGCNDPQYPRISTNVAQFTNWIVASAI